MSPRCSLLLLASCLVVLVVLVPVSAIRCFQCSSDHNVEKVDLAGRRPPARDSSDECGAYEAFDVRRQTPVDCGAEEAVSAGTFCLKSIEQGPRGFVWDGRWRTVTRRCAQVSDRGISWGCDFGYHENGVYWEHCYCAQDACNLSTRVSATAAAVVGGSVFLLLLLLLPPPLQ